MSAASRSAVIECALVVVVACRRIAWFSTSWNWYKYTTTFSIAIISCARIIIIAEDRSMQAALFRIAEINGASVAVVAVDGSVRASVGCTIVDCASIVIIAFIICAWVFRAVHDGNVDASPFPVTLIDCAWIAVIAVNGCVITCSSFGIAVIYGARIVIIARVSLTVFATRDWYMVASLDRITIIVCTRIEVVAGDRSINTSLSGAARVDGTLVSIVAVHSRVNASALCAYVVSACVAITAIHSNVEASSLLIASVLCASVAIITVDRGMYA